MLTHAARRFAVAAGLMMMALAGLVATASEQQSTQDKPFSLLSPSLFGVDNFHDYCSPCHGRDGTGHGPVAAALKTAPTDLTQLASKNKGVFPRARVRDYITNGAEIPAHGSTRDAGVGSDLPRPRLLRSFGRDPHRERRRIPGDHTKMTTRLCALIVSALLLGVTVADAQTARTGRLMQEKLLHSQRILAALTTSNYALLQKETLALTQVTKNPTWTELMTSELRPYTGGFTKALADLTAAADKRDFDAAAASYSAVTAACFTCHKHVMSSRIARARAIRA